MMQKTNIIINDSMCAGCLLCQLRCSFVYTGAFNLEKSNIVIAEQPSGTNKISFTDNCKKGCSLCAQYCTYRAIVLRKREKRDK
jgi:Pyruvate/2-oxoacid:ferredoxin oxidoreductase delta subunit